MKAIVPLSCIYDMKKLEISMIKYKILKKLLAKIGVKPKGARIYLNTEHSRLADVVDCTEPILFYFAKTWLKLFSS